MKQFAQRRARLLDHMRRNGGGVAIIATACERMRNSDVEYPFRHDSYFYYLSGVTEPEAVIVLVAQAGGERGQALLFCREKDPEHEIWHGFRHGPEGARTHFGFDAAFPIAELDARIPGLLSRAPALYASVGHDAALDARLAAWLSALRRQGRAGARVPAAIHDVHLLLDEMRLIKDDSEIASMRAAAAISAQAQVRAMRFARPGVTEYQIEAELLHQFRSCGAAAPAYPSIVATGANTCVLHHNAGAAIVGQGDLILIDAGCEFDSYASDITRTFPAAGKFGAAHRTIYEIVLAAQAAALTAVRPGMAFNQVHDAAVAVLAQGMLDTGLLDKTKLGSVEDVIANGHYRRFFMCRTSHWLGLDVHDVGAYREAASQTEGGPEAPWRRLAPGMTLTVEPGIYIRPAPDLPQQYWNIGVRIEDDVLVTHGACDILSNGVPKTVADIEMLMAG